MKKKGFSIPSCVHINNDDLWDEYGGKLPPVGTEVILVHIVDESRPSVDYWRIHPTAHQPATMEDGIAGNMNREIKLFHGWRGTSNNTSVTAHGVHAVINAKQIHRPASEIDVPLYEIEISEDIHPDWD